jgi:hypothetical protein
MGDKLITDDLAAAVSGKLNTPGIVLWNRLEGRPRTDNFVRALRAEVRDPLWMLTRQWQLGEFQGDDAGSPIAAKIRVDTTRVRHYRPADGAVEPFDDAAPLDVRVERQPIPLRQNDVDLALDVRLLMGRYWLKLVRTLAPAAVPEYIELYPVHQPLPDQPGAAPICAHPRSWAEFAAASGRLMDGARLYLHLTRDGGHASDGISAVSKLKSACDGLGTRFVAWFDQLFAQPQQDSAWVADQLEYRFSCSVPHRQTERVLVGEEYFHGRLDWYNLDVDPSAAPLGEPGESGPAAEQSHVLTMLPTQVTFNGMPHTRWWTFEDSRTNFGDIKPDTTDLAKLLLIEFGLVYANDWYLVPFTVPAGTIATVRGIAVTNVFGERTWVEPAGRGDDEDWQRWAMFGLSTTGSEHLPADRSLVILPVAQQVLDGPALEEVALARDELANLVWAVEKTVTLPTGAPVPGAEAAHETLQFFESRLANPVEQPAPAPGARVRYQVMTSVPENWIPLIPVHLPGDNREVQLQRGAMPRTIDGDPNPPSPVRPRTTLLRPGLDAQPPQPYFLHEEAVPRAGTVVRQGFRRTRWRDGRTYVWLATRKQTGRGESSSGLSFDRITDIPPET